LECELAKAIANRAARPRDSATRWIDDAEEDADGKLTPILEPRTKLLPAPVIHADDAPPPALAAADQDRTLTWLEIGLVERQSLRDPQTRSP
jgi:hypothetical protein